jgi:DNA-binding MarR family transcriptional regulator
MNFSRALWQRIETLHAVTYFGEETVEAGNAAGMSGFWMGYFGFRAAPMGAVGRGVVEATFFNFAPSFVERWVPEVWQRSSPEALVATRSGAAAQTLNRLVPSIASNAAEGITGLRLAVDRCIGAGRPLFAANRRVALPDDPVAALWQLCTTLREHRGDGHVAALCAAGLDGIEAHVLIALDQRGDPEDLQRTRGWTAADWSAAVERCRARGLVDTNGGLTDAGRALRHDVERTTDRLAMAPWNAVPEPDRDRLMAALEPAARAVSASGVIRYPNPIGLPSIA